MGMVDIADGLRSVTRGAMAASRWVSECLLQKPVKLCVSALVEQVPQCCASSFKQLVLWYYTSIVAMAESIFLLLTEFRSSDEKF